MIVYRRPVRFEEVDGANIVFFARYVHYAHEAMEHFFAPLEGGYPHLTMSRKVGFPAVDLHLSWKAPLRYGDVARIETSVARLGNRSCVLRYRIVREHDGVLACEAEHTVVTCDLSAMAPIDMPPDVRAQLLLHLEAGAPSAAESAS